MTISKQNNTSKKSGEICITTKLFFQVLICFILVIAVHTQAQGPWTRKTDIPTPRMGLCKCVVDGKIYAIGGWDKNKVLNTVEAYDPSIDRWNTRASMGTRRYVFAACALNGKIYAIGGAGEEFHTDPSSLSSVEVYDPSINKWSPVKSLPSPKEHHSACTVNGKIYVIGGSENGRKIFEYDPTTDVWTQKSDMSTEVSTLGTCVAVDGKIYLIGGAAGQFLGIKGLGIMHVYDPLVATWESKADMPTGRFYLSVSAVDGIIYAIGGAPGYARRLSAVEAYDPLTDSWIKQTSMPNARWCLSSSTVNGKIYSIGGSVNGDFSNPPSALVEEYDPSKDLLTLLKNVNLSKCYAKADNDSVCIYTETNETTGVSLLAEIEAPDQTPIETLQLFDDGNHNDVFANDKLYANMWRVSSQEEQHYYIDLIVKRIDQDTIIQHIDNMAVFTSMGPIKVISCSGNDRDNIPNPGDSNFKFKVILKNNGLASAATDIIATLICSHDKVEVIGNKKSFDNIAPGAQESNNGWYVINIDENCPKDDKLFFNVDISSNGNTFWSDTLSLYINKIVGVESHNSRQPMDYRLYQNYPNPFNPETSIKYEIPKHSFVEIKVMNLLGQEIRTLVNKKEPAGFYEITWNAIDNFGKQVPVGIYFYRLTTEEFCYTRKMALVK